MRQKGACDLAHGLARGNFVIHQHQGTGAIERFLFGQALGPVQEVIHRMRVRLLEPERQRRIERGPGGVQEHGFASAAHHGFPYALAQPGSRLAQGDANRGTLQTDLSDFVRQVPVRPRHRGGAGRDMLSQHLAHEQEASLGVVARSESAKIVQAPVGLLHMDGKHTTGEFDLPPGGIHGISADRSRTTASRTSPTQKSVRGGGTSAGSAPKARRSAQYGYGVPAVSA